jgi:adenylosuccinate synthase
MANTVVVGMQWGDEGKGKIVDLICPAFDAVVRFQGGNNAGHTIRFGDKRFALHLIPSGIFHESLRCALGNGMVVDPNALFQELRMLAEAGIQTEARLFISNRAHLLLPVHVELDKVREEARGGSRIGTTSRGIGPAYEDKVSRYGMRLCDLSARDLEERLEAQLGRLEIELKHREGASLGGSRPLVAKCREWAKLLKPYLRDVDWLLNQWIDEGRSLLFEGAQGTLLDLDHGTYPYVTSSNSTAGGACTGTGVAPTRLTGSLGVLKAYTTRVGAGPFVTELDDPMGEYLRGRGNEFGTTTGRPRRCGWPDMVTARYSRRINGVEAIALTKLDVLDELGEIPVCIGYRLRGTLYQEYGTDFQGERTLEPVYRVMKGWKSKTTGVLDYEDLPQQAKDFIHVIEDQVGAPVVLVSTGPRREEAIVRELPALDHLTSGRFHTIVEQRQLV